MNLSFFFLVIGISILYVKPHAEPRQLFSFIKPLSNEVWLYIATSFLCISLLIAVVAKYKSTQALKLYSENQCCLYFHRMAAADWENPHPGNKEPEELESIWNLHNCMWLSVGSIMQQGCDILPK